MTTTSSHWRRATLHPSATVREAIQNLNDVAIRIALVVDESGVLLGTVSDGDVRRGLLRGVDLDGAVLDVAHRDPLVVPEAMAPAAVRQLMSANKILHMPVVDPNGRLVGLHVWDAVQVGPRLSNVLVIMAGGKGTRLLPDTETCPKPMLPIGGKPMLQHVVERACTDGFAEIILCVHYLGHVIEDFFGDGQRFGVNISYVKESEPLGTAGALSLLRHRPESAFLVSNADVLSDVSFSGLLQFHIGQGAEATMAVRAHVWQHPFGVVRTEGMEIVGFEEKPVSKTYINAGVYALQPAALDVLRPGEHCDMPQLFDRLKGEGRRTLAFPLHESWMDVGRHEDLGAARRLASGKPA
jgi:dTDP-glucose pyrophosphorylase